MKKVLAVIVLVIALALSGCSLEADYYTKEEMNEIVETLQPTQLDRFLNEVLMLAMTDGSLTFIELDETYTETIESYGYGNTYVFEALVPTTLQISIVVDNSLELCYYLNGFEMDEGQCSTIETMEVIEVTVPVGFFTFDTESWDDTNDSTITIIVREVN